MVAGRVSYKRYLRSTFSHADSGGFEKPPLRKHKRWLQALENLTTMTRTTILYLTLLLGIDCINKPETSQGVGAFSTVYDTLEQFQIPITLTDEK
jgi:hypothetical protein